MCKFAKLGLSFKQCHQSHFAKVLWEFLMVQAKTLVFIVEQRLYNNITSMPMSAMYRVKVLRIILFLKMVNPSVFWKKRMFLKGPISKVLKAVLWEFRASKLCSCQLLIQSILQATQASISLTWCDDGYQSISWLRKGKEI